MAFAVRSTGCDSPVPGEPRVISANRARVTAHVPVSNRFTPRQVPLCGLSRRPAFTAAGCSEPRSLQPTPPAPASSRSRVVSDSAAHRRETQCWGFLRWPQAASCERWRAAQPVLPVIRFTSWELPRCPAGLPSGVGCNRTRVSHAAYSQACQRGAVGRRAALIFEHLRARLPAQSPAMAASRAWRSTQ